MQNFKPQSFLTKMDCFWLVFPLPLIWGVIILFSTRRTRSRKLPPGPATLPIIGNLHLLGDKPHRSLSKLAKTHGPIMILKLGQSTAVIISSPELAKEVLQKNDLDFSGKRWHPDAVHSQDHSEHSVVWAPVGPGWRSLRKIMNSYIFSGSRLDGSRSLRFKKVQELLESCETRCRSREAVDIGGAAFRTSLNLMSNIIFSRDLTDPFADSGKEFKDLVWEILAISGRPNMVDSFPMLRRIDPQGARARMNVLMLKMFDKFRGLIAERKDMIGAPANRDLLDDMLDLSRNNPEEINWRVVEHLFMDLFIAGTDTNSGTTEWAMAEMLKNPATLKKAQSELTKVIGRGKQINETDLVNLPYLQCMVKETLRMHAPIPFLVPRKVEKDVEVGGYVVPAGAQVLVNAWAIGRDETIWEDPLAFKPERFLESGVDFRGRDFELIPFGAGRRICPGLSLVARTIPVVLGSLLNVFDWELEGGIKPEDLDMEEKFGITLQKAKPLRAIPIPFAL